MTDNYIFDDFSHFICNGRNIIHAATRDSAVSSLPEDSTDGFRELDRYNCDGKPRCVGGVYLNDTGRWEYSS